MSYAVIKTGGKQYKVKSGEILKIEKLPDSKPETKIEFNEILAYGDDKSIEIGTPNVELSLIHIWRCRRSTLCRSRWSPYH